MNFIYISPNFPENFYHFCKALKAHNVNVLGIGDCSYDNLKKELKDALCDYYYVKSLENYDEVYKAVAYFAYKYGKIDWLESNNEYWLLQDAKLRTDFNISSGIKNDEIAFIKYKSEMKKIYQEAMIKTARYHLADDYDNTKIFIDEVGYPVIVKPNNGVGASNTYKIINDDELKKLFVDNKHKGMIIEEFINGELISYDGIVNSKREVIYATSHYFPKQVMNLVNDKEDCFYWSIKDIPNDLKTVGDKVVKCFPTNSRCFHLEFFRLNEDKRGLGKKGDIIGLEVNMRTPGGVTPDMMNYASDINIYDIYADMICYDSTLINTNDKKYYCVYASRRDEYTYLKTLDEVNAKYHNNIVMNYRNPQAISSAMGDDVILARFENYEEIKPFIQMVVGK